MVQTRDSTAPVASVVQISDSTAPPSSGRDVVLVYCTCTSCQPGDNEVFSRGCMEGNMVTRVVLVHGELCLRSWKTQDFVYRSLPDVHDGVLRVVHGTTKLFHFLFFASKRSLPKCYLDSQMKYVLK